MPNVRRAGNHRRPPRQRVKPPDKPARSLRVLQHNETFRRQMIHERPERPATRRRTRNTRRLENRSPMFRRPRHLGLAQIFIETQRLNNFSPLARHRRIRPRCFHQSLRFHLCQFSKARKQRGIPFIVRRFVIYVRRILKQPIMRFPIHLYSIVSPSSFKRSIYRPSRFSAGVP